MTAEAHLSPRRSWLALLCACVVMLAWAVPAFAVVSGNTPDFLKRSQDHQASDPADASAEVEDTSDDPAVFLAADKAGLLPLTFALQASQLTKRAWSPSSPVRPPNNFITI